MNEIMNMRDTTLVNTFIGPGSSRLVGQLCEQMGLSKAFVVCDAGVKEAGLVDGILESLQEKGIASYLFPRVTADAPDTTIDEAAEIYREQKCQITIAIGGGSTLDTAKSIAMLQNNPGKIAEYVLDASKTRVKGGKLILIPTTAGTGSEITTGMMVAVASKGIKAGCAGRDLLADYALVDPLLTLGLPPKQTAATAMDAFSHCVESMLSGLSNPVCDVLSLEGIRLIVNNIEKVMQNCHDVEARQNVMFAAYLGGMSLNDGACGFGHSIAHVLGAKYHLPHGLLCGLALPMVIEFSAEIYPAKLRKIAEAMNVAVSADANNTEVAVAIANTIRALNGRLGLPRFSELGFSYEDLPELSQLIMHEGTVNILRLSVPNREITPQDFLIPMQKEYNRK